MKFADTSLDRSLLKILASLADLSQCENSQNHGMLPSASVEQVLSQVTAFEERDSLLSQVRGNDSALETEITFVVTSVMCQCTAKI